jgi:hypothetical protein
MYKKLIALLFFTSLTWTATAQAQGLPRAANGKPDLNGVWQTMNSANYNLEGHTSSQGAVETLGAIGAVIPGLSVVQGGSIPYQDEALVARQNNFTNRRTEDPEAKCYLPGIPRATYMPHPFQILQTDGDIMIAYQYAGGVRTIAMENQMSAPVDSWMGWSNGSWDGDTLVVEVTGLNGQSWLDRSGNFASITMSVEERYTLVSENHINYEATITDAAVFERPWTISMPLYRRLEENARLLEFKCVEFAEEMMYQYLRKPEDI